MAMFSILLLNAQVHEDKNWCIVNCDPSIHRENADLIYSKVENDSLIQEVLKSKKPKFPLRFAFVKEYVFEPNEETTSSINQVVKDLNHSYRHAHFEFYLDTIEVISSELKLEDLSQNRFEIYDGFSENHDKEDQITVYILDHKKDFCTITERGGLSCSRVGGFSYILSTLTNNIVLSLFDLTNSKVVAHEFGHFFGLYHTFERDLFGHESKELNDCNAKGDLICDTPLDPGTIYEIYVNYTSCEMLGLTDTDGNSFDPLIENYMSYYKPCYLKEFSFTDQQLIVMNFASQLSLRKVLSR
jgi:hypothetical protein